MGELVDVITAYGFRKEVSQEYLFDLYGPKYRNRLASALETLVSNGKIEAYQREDQLWYRKVD